MIFPVKEGAEGFKKAFEGLLQKAEQAVDDHKNFIILSDRQVSEEFAPIPSLLAVAAVHHHLIQTQKRMQIGIIVETGEAREISHFAMLFGYGASSVNPYLAFAAIDNMVKSGEINMDYAKARYNYIKSINKGLLKILSKMGISTLRSYHGCQLFESLGVSNEIISKYFTGTASKFSGMGLEEICHESLLFHKEAYGKKETTDKRPV